MTNKSNYKIKQFSDKSDIALLEEIYLLNQANTPEVGSLESLNHLKVLLSKSIKNIFISHQSSLVGYIVCFRENSDYSSENYKFFSKSEKSFMYIDRIAINKEFRRNGLAKHLYKNIEKMGGGALRTKLVIYHIQRYYFRYKTHWSTYIFEDRILLYLLSNIYPI